MQKDNDDFKDWLDKKEVSNGGAQDWSAELLSLKMRPLHSPSLHCYVLSNSVIYVPTQRNVI